MYAKIYTPFVAISYIDFAFGMFYATGGRYFRERLSVSKSDRHSLPWLRYESRLVGFSKVGYSSGIPFSPHVLVCAGADGLLLF